MLIFGPELKWIPRLNPDGSEILYLSPTDISDLSRPVRLMRAPANGGPPRAIFELPFISNHQCAHAPSTVCIFTQQLPGAFVFTQYDYKSATRREIMRVPEQKAGWNWSLSPDGKTIALLPFRSNRIQLSSLSGQTKQDIEAKGWDSFTSVDWAADNNGLFMTSNRTGLMSVLLYIDLKGNAHELWRVKSPMPNWAIASHSGKYVAIPAPTIVSNVWMAENF
jgi:hypothetical protein